VAPKKPGRLGGEEPAPRWPDGQIRLGSSRRPKRLLGEPRARARFENSAKIAMSDEGILRNPADANSRSALPAVGHRLFTNIASASLLRTIL